ncbi:OsmC family protein [Lacipirellula parvula]|uniref:Peroxiredoxin OsmC n=1 Tax=Lacipirellula parvula TaxID=2650471 RepID=A0A5K7X932_9BACT|nr:OsmC family protein [Lacipirellula parvula]BBO33294.1 peroxiredoxin OsmC [Lacipirellula parvula]
MPARSATAVWNGDIMSGNGTMKLGTGAWEGPYSFKSRFEDGKGTNPEELIAAAHAGCFSMALSGALTKAGHPPEKIETSADVVLVKDGEGFKIPSIKLKTAVKVAGLDEAQFQAIAKAAKENCPVSKVLAAAEITLDAKLVN